MGLKLIHYGESGGVLFMLKSLFVRDGKLFAALLPAGSEHPAAVGCGHPFTESVFILSFPARGLIRAFHGR